MERYWDIFLTGYESYARYLLMEIAQPHWKNYFYWLIAVSAVFFALELLAPWRKEQKKFRQDFWLDLFYVFFNYFLFSLFIYNAASDVVVNLFNDLLGLVGITNLVAIQVNTWPVWVQLVVLFIVRDFIHWNVHRLLHRVPALWELHKVHHSVEQLGFAAHLRFHWMENVVYNGLQYIPLAMIGFGIEEFFIVYLITLVIGHANHSNIILPLGPLRYLINNPQMHIWHHAKEWPKEYPYGINFGISLSLWDYLFKTASIPHDGRDIVLGFPDVEHFPKTFFGQNLHGIGLPEKPSDS